MNWRRKKSSYWCHLFALVVRLDKIFKKNLLLFLLMPLVCMEMLELSNMYDGGRLLSWILENEPENISFVKHARCFTNTKQCTSSTVKQTKGPKVKLKRENKFFLQFWEREILKSCFQKRYPTNPKFSFSCFEKRNLNKIIFFSFKNTNNCLKFFSLISGKEKWRLYSSSPMPPFLLLVVGKQYRLVAQY